MAGSHQENRWYMDVHPPQKPYLAKPWEGNHTGFKLRHLHWGIQSFCWAERGPLDPEIYIQGDQLLRP